MDYRQQVLSEIVAVMEQGADLTLDQIEAGLGAIYAQYLGEQWVTDTITQVWARVQTLATGADKAVMLAAVARELADQRGAQRDAAIKAVGEVKAAADRLDRSHPIVDAVAEGIEEAIAEEMEFNGTYGLLLVAQNMTTLAELPISQEEADTFIGMIANDALDNVDPTIAADLRKRLGRFISKMVVHYSAAADVWAEQHPFTALELVEEGEL